MRSFLLALATLLPLAAPAQELPFDPALIGAPPVADDDSPRGLRLELWRQQFDWRRRPAGEVDFAWRGVADFRREWNLDAHTRLGFSDRLEAVWNPGQAKADSHRNSLRELFVSRRIGEDYVDLGRINQRQGFATGYNPTDFLRANAVVSRSSLDPVALRENRLGTVMLRGQHLAAWGAAQLSLIPQLSDRDRFESEEWSLGLARTNRRSALLLRLAPRAAGALATDLGAYAKAGEHPQFAANASLLANDALLMQLEWAGGVRPYLPGPGEAHGQTRWANRIGSGITWTTPWRPVLTLEHQFAQDALSATQWQAWRDSRDGRAQQRLGDLRASQQERQEPLTRRAWFLRLEWEQLFDRRDLDLTALARLNAYDRSKFVQLELRWHADARYSLRALLNRYVGGAASEYGASSLHHAASLYLQMYL